MNKPTPSPFRIIQSDYLAMIGLLAPAVFLVLYICVAVFGFFPGFRGHDPIQGTDGAPLFFYGFIISALLGIPMLVRRIKIIQSIFASGVEVTGKIEDIFFQRDRGSVMYRYEYQGKEYKGASAVMKNDRTEALLPGRSIILIVSKDDPSRALIRDLYV